VSGYLDHIRAGKLRALAVTSATRLEALPNVPIMGDFVPGFEASTWSGLGARKNTPAEIVDKLNSANARLMSGLDHPQRFRPRASVHACA